LIGSTIWGEKKIVDQIRSTLGKGGEALNSIPVGGKKIVGGERRAGCYSMG